MGRVLRTVLPIVGLLLGPSGILGSPRHIREAALQRAFETWDVQTMRRLLLMGSSTREDFVWWGALKLLEGDLASAEHFLSRSRDPLARSLRPVAKGSRAVLTGLVESTSPRQRIKVFHPPGPVEFLLPTLFEAGDASVEIFVERLGFEGGFQETIPVWVVPSFEEMVQVTGLDRSRLDAAGTVAVCDLRRIVLVSPEALPWGYPYADTLSHEIVHFLLTVRGGGRVPVWFQEGVAKAWERSWRGRPVGEMGRTASRLLDDATLQRRWIPLDRIERGLLNLGSPEAVQLAFAEVAAFVTWTTARVGEDAVARLVEEMRTGDSEVAFLRVVGARPAEWFEAFLEHRTLGVPQGQDPKSPVLMRERIEAPGSGPEVESRIRLAGRLAEAGRFLAASSVLREVLESLPVPHPEVVGRLARVLRQGGKPQDALVVLDGASMDEEEFPWLARERGLALWALGRASNAVEPLLILLRNDPWDQEARRALVEAARISGRRDLAEREERLLLLGR